MTTTPEYDAIVIGGGPAGSTAAALIAERGHKVLLLEREEMPRYHIGESLIPYTWFTLNRLGVIDKMRQSANPKKHSVQFVSVTGKVSQPFYFFQTIKHECSVTWQVVRSEFDSMLLDNAREKGAEIRQGMHVRDVIIEGGVGDVGRAGVERAAVGGVGHVGRAGVERATAGGVGRVVGVRYDEVGGRKGLEVRAKVVVDASGRDSMLSRKFAWKDRDVDLNKIAVWSYFKGAKRDPGVDEGATTVAYVPNKGWFWYIPQHSDIVSVGVVGEPGYLYRDTRNPDEIFAREVQACSWIHDHVKDAEQCEPVRVTGEYSYHSQHIGGDGFCLVGDAFAFLDPLFSTGVFLALKSGEMAADAIHEGLVAGDLSKARFDSYLDRQRHAVKSFRSLVTSFYDLTFSFREFLQEYPHLHSSIVDTLVGNVFTDLDPLYKALGEFSARESKKEIAATTA